MPPSSSPATTASPITRARARAALPFAHKLRAAAYQPRPIYAKCRECHQTCFVVVRQWYGSCTAKSKRYPSAHVCGCRRFHMQSRMEVMQHHALVMQAMEKLAQALARYRGCPRD